MQDFITNNQILFIVLGILIVMAIIGYAADKNNIGKKENKPVKKKKEEQVPERVIEEETIIEESEPVQESTELVFDSEPNEMEPVIQDEGVLEPAIEYNEEMSIESVTQDDFSAPLEGFQNPIDVTAVASELGVDPSILTTPIEGNQPVSDEYGIDNVPSLHADGTPDNQNSGDVWKF